MDGQYTSVQPGDTAAVPFLALATACAQTAVRRRGSTRCNSVSPQTTVYCACSAGTRSQPSSPPPSTSTSTAAANSKKACWGAAAPPSGPGGTAGSSKSYLAVGETVILTTPPCSSLSKRLITVQGRAIRRQSRRRLVAPGPARVDVQAALADRLKGTEPEVIRAISCSGIAFYHNPR